jgi:hypothetical protein
VVEPDALQCQPPHRMPSSIAFPDGMIVSP